ncbi:MAG: ABC transporter substrate-binding protein [Clostridiales bacterium]|nr:ABC transporter substrate-binding protein [Clostridiales bacterium]MCR5057031.1 ABC transporter substrate-binding protein [Clostridiales bacterium]
MKKKLLAGLLSVSIALCAFAACAKKNDETDSAATTATQTEETSSDASESASELSSESDPEVKGETKESENPFGDPNGTHTVVDHAGDSVEVPNTINRIAVGSFYPLASVITEYLGSAEKIVGIHPVSMSAAENGLLGQIYPEILDANTAFISGDEVNLEELLILKPDIVIGVGQEQAKAIREAGIPAVTTSASAWGYDIIETYEHWIDLLDQIFGGSEFAKKAMEKSDAVHADIIEKTKDIPDDQKARVLVLFKYTDAAMVASGVNFFGQWWCESVNAYNVASEVPDGSILKISMEQVYEWNPDVIIITNFCGTQPEDLYNNAIGTDDWSTINAVKNQRVYKMPLGLYRSYTPGGDSPVTMQWMASVIYPDLFKDTDIRQIAKEYYKEMCGYDLSDEQLDMMFIPSRDAARGL